jgi:toxin ParE1/3/4
MSSLIFDVFLSEGAERDLKEMYNYKLRSQSLASAANMIEMVNKKIASLEQFPLRGSIPNDVVGFKILDIRQIIYNNYRIIYRVRNNQVFIIIIADGRRDMQAILERRLLTS